MKILLSLAAALITGCSTIDYSSPPPADFPKLAITVHEYDDIAGARTACAARYDAYGIEMPAFLVACSEYRFDTMTCDIHVPRGDSYLLTYEHAKCAGYNNAGDTSTVDTWRAWKAQNK